MTTYIVFDRKKKKLSDGKGPFGGDVSKIQLELLL